jgi:hypothetical protein
MVFPQILPDVLALLRRSFFFKPWSGCRITPRKNRAMGRKVRTSTDVASTALGKEEMAVRL